MLTFNQILLLLKGMVVTLQISLGGMVLGSLIGMIVGFLRASGNPFIKNASLIYVEIFRDSPLLIQLFVVYYGLPILFDINVPALLTAFIAITLYTSGYMAEVFKSSIEAISVTQWESAYSLGLPFHFIARRIILPQALRLAVPPSVGVLIMVIKDSSLASVIGFVELTRMANIVRAQTFTTFNVYAMTAVIYFMMCYSISSLGTFAENKLVIRHE